MKAFFRTSRVIILSFVLVSTLTFQTLASIYSLTPGSSIPALSSGFPTGGSVLNSLTTPFSTAVISGSLTSQVISGDASNPFGGLTFTYRLNLDGASIDPVSQISISSYANILTDLSFNLSGGGTAPSTFSRSSGTGNVLRFEFDSPNISPGSSSALIVVQTSAATWNNTTAGIINGLTANVASLAPLAVPEPATAALVLAGFGVWALRRRMTK